MVSAEVAKAEENKGSEDQTTEEHANLTEQTEQHFEDNSTLSVSEFQDQTKTEENVDDEQEVNDDFDLNKDREVLNMTEENNDEVRETEEESDLNGTESNEQFLKESGISENVPDNSALSNVQSQNEIIGLISNEQDKNTEVDKIEEGKIVKTDKENLVNEEKEVQELADISQNVQDKSTLPDSQVHFNTECLLANELAIKEEKEDGKEDKEEKAKYRTEVKALAA